MLELLKSLSSLRLAPVSPDTDRSAEILSDALPFSVHEYNSGSDFNGWTVPLNWQPTTAEIRRDGELVLDGMASPLGVIGYSQSFKGTVNREELVDHLFSHRDRPDDLVYHCDLYYKQAEQDWGFTIPGTLKDSLSPGDYDVDLATEFSSGTMKVLEYTLPGRSSDTYVINAHNCHAGQANDDLSGVVAGVELMRRLAEIPDRRFTYQLIIAPEHFGTVFYLSERSLEEIGRYRGCIFLEAVGNDNRLALQESFTADSSLDDAADLYLARNEPGYERLRFREVVGNDEVVWEAPGYEIPTISLTRFPFPEYHTDKDTIDIIQEKRLDEAVEASLRLLMSLDRNVVMHRKFTGLIALSNPKYDLYRAPGTDPSAADADAPDLAEWNRLMVDLPRDFDGKTTVLDVAVKHGLPFDAVREYVQRFEEKGLIETESV